MLTTIESVVYDPTTEFIYTANIVGHFMEKDGNGTLSKLTLDGDIVDSAWIQGLNAPTGLTIANGMLYTTDIDRIIEVDIRRGQISNTYSIEEAKALNDITISDAGVLYASDTGGNAIFQLQDGRVSTLLRDIETPNGLLYRENKLLVTQWTPQTLGTLAIASSDLSPIAAGITQADGVEVLGDIGFLVAGWEGKVYYVSHNSEPVVILDTTQEGIQAADVTYLPERNMVLVATFDRNSVMAYRIDV